jgi:RES domain-containing protein
VPVDVDRTAVIGRWVRHGPDGAPAWPPLRVPAPDGRWNRGDVVGALYLADSEETAWAEWYRHLAEKGIPPDEQMPRRLWQWDVDVRVANLSTTARLRRAGLGVPPPGRHTWAPYQNVGLQLWREGWAGLLAPSAARPKGSRPLPVPRRRREDRRREAGRTGTSRRSAAGAAHRYDDLASGCAQSPPAAKVTVNEPMRPPAVTA